MNCFPLNYQTLLEVDTAPEATPEYARVAAGVSSFDPANNDSLDQTGYLDGEGYQSTDVVAAQYVLAMSGHRVYGDAAQDFIFSKQFELGCARKTNARQTAPDGSQKTGEITLANLDDGGGEANAKQEIAFEFHFNGKPTITPAITAGALTSIVAAGSVAGSTKFTATPGAGNTLAYKLGAATFGNLKANQYLGGMTPYVSAEDLPAAVGQFLLMLEIDANDRIVLFAEHELTAPDIA